MKLAHLLTLVTVIGAALAATDSSTTTSTKKTSTSTSTKTSTTSKPSKQPTPLPTVTSTIFATVYETVSDDAAITTTTPVATESVEATTSTDFVTVTETVTEVATEVTNEEVCPALKTQDTPCSFVRACRTASRAGFNANEGFINDAANAGFAGNDGFANDGFSAIEGGLTESGLALEPIANAGYFDLDGLFGANSGGFFGNDGFFESLGLLLPDDVVFDSVGSLANSNYFKPDGEFANAGFFDSGVNGEFFGSDQFTEQLLQAAGEDGLFSQNPDATEPLERVFSPAVANMIKTIASEKEKELRGSSDLTAEQLVGIGATLQICDAIIGCGAYAANSGWYPDCADSNTLPTDTCNQGKCNRAWIADGICDLACNTIDCNNDGGDCDLLCSPLCKDEWRGDGVCDPGCNNAACDYDDGDCEQ